MKNIAFKTVFLMLSTLIINYSVYAASEQFQVSMRIVKGSEFTHTSANNFELKGETNENFNVIVLEDEANSSFEAKISMVFDSNNKAKIKVGMDNKTIKTGSHSNKATLRVIHF